MSVVCSSRFGCFGRTSGEGLRRKKKEETRREGVSECSTTNEGGDGGRTNLDDLLRVSFGFV